MANEYDSKISSFTKECDVKVSQVESQKDEVLRKQRQKFKEQLQTQLKKELGIDYQLIKKEDEALDEFCQAVKEQYKGKQQMDEDAVQAMRECWEQVCERFKQFNHAKH